MAILNTIVAEALDEVANKLEPVVGKRNFNSVVSNMVKQMITKHDRVIFYGNGYSDEWIKEAERRGLPHLKTTPEALQVLSRTDTVKLLEKYNVLSKAELLARKDVQEESYLKLIFIEAKTCLNMLQTIYLPAIAQQMTEICNTVAAIKAAGLKAGLKAAVERANAVGALYDELPARVKALQAAIDKGCPVSMKEAMDSARVTVDALEAIVDAELWPVPTYAQMLNIHGKYPANWPGLRFDALEAIKAEVGDMPLVLHGGTGIPEDMIKKAISLGVAKINVNTECQIAFSAAVRKYIEEGKDLVGKGFDPRKVLAPGCEAIKETVREKMEIFGCIGKA